MDIFKFGGASVKDADGVKNLANIVRDYKKGKLLIVISAMGKICLLYTSPSPRDLSTSRMPSSA